MSLFIICIAFNLIATYNQSFIANRVVGVVTYNRVYTGA